MCFSLRRVSSSMCPIAVSGFSFSVRDLTFLRSLCAPSFSSFLLLPVRFIIRSIAGVDQQVTGLLDSLSLLFSSFFVFIWGPRPFTSSLAHLNRRHVSVEDAPSPLARFHDSTYHTGFSRILQSLLQQPGSSTRTSSRTSSQGVRPLKFVTFTTTYKIENEIFYRLRIALINRVEQPVYPIENIGNSSRLQLKISFKRSSILSCLDALSKPTPLSMSHMILLIIFSHLHPQCSLNFIPTQMKRLNSRQPAESSNPAGL